MTEFTGGGGTVDVPVAGRVKKRYLAIPAVAALGYVGWRWYQARQTAAAAPQPSDGTYTTPDMTDLGLNTSGGATDITGNSGNTTTDGTPTGVFTNDAWANLAVDKLTQQGWDGKTVQAALGDFLAHQALNKDEATIARAAIAAAGQPPVGGPWSVQEEAGDTGTLAAPTNLRAGTAATTTSVGLQWDAVPGAAHYRLYRTDLGDEPIGDSLDTKATVHGLQPHHTYGFFVRAMSTTGKLGGKSSVFTGKTTDVKLTPPTGLHSSAVTKSSFRVTANKVAGATYYRWYLNGTAHGASDNPYYDFTGLRSNTTYTVTVASDTTSQTPSKPSSGLHVKTKK